MKKLAIVFAVGAAALLGGSAANASDNTVKAKAATDVTQTDFSSHRKNYRHRHRVVRSYHRPYYGSYGYAPRRAYYAPQPYYARQPYYYGGGAPIISFGFGGGGFGGGGWGHHRRGW